MKPDRFRSQTAARCVPPAKSSRQARRLVTEGAILLLEMTVSKKIPGRQRRSMKASAVSPACLRSIEECRVPTRGAAGRSPFFPQRCAPSGGYRTHLDEGVVPNLSPEIGVAAWPPFDRGQHQGVGIVVCLSSEVVGDELAEEPGNDHHA